MFAFRKNAWAVGQIADGGLQVQTSVADLSRGLLSGTQVATVMGWRDVAAVAAGDQVLTFDDGLQTVSAVHHTYIETSEHRGSASDQLIYVPSGVLGNAQEMTLLPSQPVMIEDSIAEEVFGDPFVVIPARHLVGYAGIHHVPAPMIAHLISLVFDQDQVVFANVGGLLVCPASTDLLDVGRPTYEALTDPVSALLVNAMKIDHTARGGYQAAA
ncbi:MAG: Hint domain-containing protein [Pseudomonadota bacterium]